MPYKQILRFHWCAYKYIIDRLKREVDAGVANMNKTRLEGHDMLVPRLKLTGNL